ncbi:MAG TPA: HPr family phosphocarrier protein [Chlamydiales bacterium]|nr:HPr family phosphocarrier protein [Chlamydiales bacterium]
MKIKNSLGLHTRPAATIVRILQPFKSSVFFTHKNETVNARSIMSLLMLAAQRNTQIEIIVEGEDAEITMNQLVEAFDQEFGERA